jgi:N6-L-threonylcarbamoyladenine synthase
MLHSGDLDFSFSGLKTAVLTQMKKLQSAVGGGAVAHQQKADLAAATEAAIVDVLAVKAVRAMDQTGLKRLVVAGGVGANRRLREQLQSAMQRRGGQVFFPPLELCTDNGAMIAYAASQRVVAGRADLTVGDHAFTVRPRWPLQDL